MTSVADQILFANETCFSQDTSIWLVFVDNAKRSPQISQLESENDLQDRIVIVFIAPY